MPARPFTGHSSSLLPTAIIAPPARAHTLTAPVRPSLKLPTASNQVSSAPPVPHTVNCFVHCSPDVRPERRRISALAIENSRHCPQLRRAVYSTRGRFSAVLKALKVSTDSTPTPVTTHIHTTMTDIDVSVFYPTSTSPCWLTRCCYQSPFVCAYGYLLPHSIANKWMKDANPNLAQDAFLDSLAVMDYLRERILREKKLGVKHILEISSKEWPEAVKGFFCITSGAGQSSSQTTWDRDPQIQEGNIEKSEDGRALFEWLTGTIG